MKKILITLVALAALTTAAHAQYNHTIGARLGAGSAFGAELSYQGFLTDINRVELDLGAHFGQYDEVHYNALSFAAIYQWHWFLAGGFGFYVGPGAKAYFREKHAGLGIGGQVGIDYQFAAPVQISLDFRPMYHLINYSGPDYGAALGIRYAF